MKAILRQVEKEIVRREGELDKLKEVRSRLAALVPGHPYSRPKLTMAAAPKRKVLHWTQTPAGWRKMRSLMLKRRAAERKALSTGRGN